MAGCHYHYKKLQEQYNHALQEKAEAERQLERAYKEAELRKKQEDSWTEKLAFIREKRKTSEEENKKLRREKKDLESYCNNLLILCSKSLETL